MVSKYGFVVAPSEPDGGVQNLGVEVACGVLSRPVSPKLAHEAVLAKPPYFETLLHKGCLPRMREGCWLSKMVWTREKWKADGILLGVPVV